MIDEAMSPLRRRMIEDMTIRKFAGQPSPWRGASYGSLYQSLARTDQTRSNLSFQLGSAPGNGSAVASYTARATARASTFAASAPSSANA
jgi:hypothetical protein